MSLISPIAFQSPESIEENTIELGLTGEEDVSTTKTRAIFALGKEPDLIPDDLSPSGFVLGEGLTDALLRASIIGESGFATDVGVSVFAHNKIKNDFLNSDRVQQLLKTYLDEKIIISKGVIVLRQDQKVRELLFGLQELLIAFFENYNYSTQQDCDKIFSKFMEILSGVPNAGIDGIFREVRKELAEVYPTTFNFARDYENIAGVSKHKVGRLVSLEKALGKIEYLPPVVDMPKRSQEEIDHRFLELQKEARGIIEGVLQLKSEI